MIFFKKEESAGKNFENNGFGEAFGKFEMIRSVKIASEIGTMSEPSVGIFRNEGVNQEEGNANFIKICKN